MTETDRDRAGARVEPRWDDAPDLPEELGSTTDEDGRGPCDQSWDDLSCAREVVDE